MPAKRENLAVLDEITPYQLYESLQTTAPRLTRLQNSTQAANAWRILFLLFLANLFNFFDRTIPAIIIEPIRMEWHLSDFQLGIIGTAFTIVY
eukprot:gene296-393_t